MLRSWIDAAVLTESTAWVLVQEAERNPQRFWVSVLDALTQTAAGSSLVRPLTAAPDLDGWAVVDRLLKDLQPLQDQAWLVIDDVHELGSAAALRQLELLLMRAPPQLRFIVATRHDLPLGLHRLRLEGEVTDIRAADLRFTLDEARALFGAAGVELPDSALALLHARTGAFVVSLDASRSWFRYHRLFADLLQLELRRTGPGELPALHATAAGWYAGHGHPAEAVRHAQAAQDWSLAARLLSDHWLGLQLDGQAATARELLNAFPADVAACDAELIALMAADELTWGSLEATQRQLALATQWSASVPADRRQRFEVVRAVLRLHPGPAAWGPVGGSGGSGLVACRSRDAGRMAAGVGGGGRPARADADQPRHRRSVGGGRHLMFGLWSRWFCLLANGPGKPCTSFDEQEEPYGYRHPAVSG